MSWIAGAFLTVSTTLVVLSSALVPSASIGDPFRIAGIRIVDLLSLFVLAIMLVSVARRIHHEARSNVSIGVLLFSLIWIVWTLLPLLVGGGDARSVIAELQFPIYLLTTWAALECLGIQALPAILTRISWLNLPVVVLGVGLAVASQSPTGGDFATLACIIALLSATNSKTSRTLVVSLFVLAVVACFLSEQRAALIISLPALGISMVVLLDLHAPRPAYFILCSLVVAISGVWAIISGGVPRIVSSLAVWYQYVFLRETQERASESRLVQFDVAVDTIMESPFFGHGGGVYIQYFDLGVDSEVVSNITHNSLLDLSIRFGVPFALGAAFCLLVLILRGVRLAIVFRDKTLWLVVCAVMVIAGKGAVESVLFKPRLAIVLAFMITVLIHLVWERSVLIRSHMRQAAPRRISNLERVGSA